MRSTAIAVVVSAALAAAISATPINPSFAADRHVVEIVKFKFVPDKLEVAPGDTIVWINKDIVPHTVTAADKSWDSTTIKKSGEWQTVVSADMPGAYFCRFHPTMKAQFTLRQ